ncbi:MAG TPA: hypothetical protein DCM07_27305 [Planctomycetaceae bacterium]|nr:hypothetical protein [Planctomycetaceae bacterium]
MPEHISRLILLSLHRAGFRICAVIVNVNETKLLLRTFSEKALSRAGADRVRSSGTAYFIGYRNWETATIGNAGQATLLKSDQSERLA